MVQRPQGHQPNRASTLCENEKMMLNDQPEGCVTETSEPRTELIEKLEPDEYTVNPDIWYSRTSDIGVDDIFGGELSSL